MGLEEVCPRQYRLDGKGLLLVEFNAAASVSGLTQEDLWNWLVTAGGGVVKVCDRERIWRVYSNGRIEDTTEYLFGDQKRFREVLIKGGLYVFLKDVRPLLRSG